MLSCSLIIFAVLPEIRSKNKGTVSASCLDNLINFSLAARLDSNQTILLLLYCFKGAKLDYGSKIIVQELLTHPVWIVLIYPLTGCWFAREELCQNNMLGEVSRVVFGERNHMGILMTEDLPIFLRLNGDCQRQ